MNPVYIDLHIHTSNDPSSLADNYDLETLVQRVKEVAKGDDFLISLTDHNTINEKVYAVALEKIRDHIILGVELHVQSHKGKESRAYHCHIYFNFDDQGLSLEKIREINSKLDELYPNKKPSLTDEGIPLVQEIIEAFDDYDFILLPHGGQTHATFDQALPRGKQFDNAMQRSIYYNFFDGFTSRSDQKTESTRQYLERIGVFDFVNLITCSDNYTPSEYPKPRNAETYTFIPTWMYASASFNGIRLSLSDRSRLEYSHEKPRRWRESIGKVKLCNSKVDIDMALTPGLNVIIGESSSGKTLLVESLYRKLSGEGFCEPTFRYGNFDLEGISIEYPDNVVPHYIRQNFIAQIAGENKTINNIEIIAGILPKNIETNKAIDQGLQKLKEQLDILFEAVERIEMLQLEISRIPILSELIVIAEVRSNVLNQLQRIIGTIEHVEYPATEKLYDLERLDEIEGKLAANPFIQHNKALVIKLKQELQEMRLYARFHAQIKKIVREHKEVIDKQLQEKEGDSQRKKQDFARLIEKMREYYGHLCTFDRVIQEMTEFKIDSESEKVIINGFTLSIEYSFALNAEMLRGELNNILLREKQLESLSGIAPEHLFRGNFRQNISGVERSTGVTYKVIRDNIAAKFSQNNKISYKIKTPEGKDFDTLSPGLKTSIILELILNYAEDGAPLIIDQPEDNLATSYMNEGLVKSIQRMKRKKQIIFVSHNATIPMAGDAQNIILCENINSKIVVRSGPLEGKIGGVYVVDHIAAIADGGKASIKKRFKKYNLKKFV